MSCCCTGHSSYRLTWGMASRRWDPRAFMGKTAGDLLCLDAAKEAQRLPQKASHVMTRPSGCLEMSLEQHQWLPAIHQMLATLEKTMMLVRTDSISLHRWW